MSLGLPLLALAMIAAAWRSIAPPSERLPPLQMRFAGKCSKPDFGTVAFQLSSPEPCSIFLVSATVEAPEADGWKAAATFARNEIVRLKPNVPQEICVEPSASDPWRLSISYGTEMHGPRLFRLQLREAWILKSFSNWTGRAWGGGRFSGNWTLTSEEVQNVR